MSSRQTDTQKFEHIRQVLLADPESNDIDRLLRGENITNLRKLHVFVRKPGLELGALTFANEGGTNSTLSEEHVDELVAMRSYLTYLQNWYGPPAVAGVANIANTTREDFIFFIHQHADRDLENDPVLPDNDLMLRSQQLRAGVYTSNSNNACSRSSSRGSSRSRSPPTRRVINHALQQNMPLKEIKEWPEFDRQLCAVAHTHGVDDVLDHRYSPVGGCGDVPSFCHLHEGVEDEQGHVGQSITGRPADMGSACPEGQEHYPK